MARNDGYVSAIQSGDLSLCHPKLVALVMNLDMEPGVAPVDKKPVSGRLILLKMDRL